MTAGYNDPAKLSDAIALAQSFKSSSFSDRQPPGSAGSKGSHNSQSRSFKTAPVARGYSRPHPVELATASGPPPPSRRAYNQINHAKLSNPLNRSGSSSLIGNAGVDFLRRNDVPPGNATMGSVGESKSIPEIRYSNALAPGMRFEASVTAADKHNVSDSLTGAVQSNTPTHRHFDKGSVRESITANAEPVSLGKSQSAPTAESSIVDTFLAHIAERLTLEQNHQLGDESRLLPKTSSVVTVTQPKLRPTIATTAACVKDSDEVPATGTTPVNSHTVDSPQYGKDSAFSLEVSPPASQGNKTPITVQDFQHMDRRKGKKPAKGLASSRWASS